MWAKDAVAALAAKGILEGYPDGTFKGDRAATRYEVAMIVARLLAKMEQEHATFATKADLEELRKLVNQLREELDALGVRVQNLEDNVAKLDKRVTELERITFYGSVDARFVSMTMSNKGLSQGINGDQSATFGTSGAQVATAGLAALSPGSLPIPGTFFLTTVGVPMAFAPTNTATLASGLAGRPLAVNPFPFNVNTFNNNNFLSANNFGGSVRSSYNLTTGSNVSLGGNLAGTQFTAINGIAVGGNPLTGMTGAPGITFAAPLVIPAFEVRTGRPWTEGTGYSGQAILGVRIKLNEDMDAGMEFAAYYSTGDPILDAFYGVSARRLSNVFTGDQGLGNSGFDGGQGINNSPWSRMNIDNFWFLHKPSNIKVQIGGFGDTHMDGLVYQPEYNPNYFGPKYLDNFGFRVSGSHHFLAKFDWEVFASNVADGNQLNNYTNATALGAVNYRPFLWGGDFKWTIGEEGNQGRIKFDIMRIWDDNSSGNATTVGSIVNVNGVWTDWANPSGFYVNQINPTGLLSNTAGIGSASDVRPITPNIAGNTGGFFGIDQTGAGLYGAATLPLLLNQSPALAGNFNLPTSSFGPQSQFTWGVTGGWDYTFNEDVKLRIFGEYGHSDYKPSMNSSYSAPTGTAFRVAGGLTVFKDWDIDGEYVNTNPYYNPFIAQYPNVLGVTQAYWRIPTMSWYPELYPTSDKDTYPNNREGWRLFLKWNPVDAKDGKHKTVLWGEYGNMRQVDTSLQQVRWSTGSIITGPTAATSAPNGFVLGNLPGFIDTVFTGYSPNSFAGYTGSTLPSAVNQFNTPLEDIRGRVTNWGLGGDYRFDALNGLKLHVGYRSWQYNRQTTLAPAFGGSENNIALDLDGGVVSLAYPINERFSIKGGYQWTDIRGHYDPIGIYRNFALDTGSVSFRTFDTTQTAPFVGFDYDIARNVNWNMNAKFLDNKDHLGTFSTPNFFLQRNPFSWSGVQVTSELKVSF